MKTNRNWLVALKYINALGAGMQLSSCALDPQWSTALLGLANLAAVFYLIVWIAKIDAANNQQTEGAKE